MPDELDFVQVGSSGREGPSERSEFVRVSIGIQVNEAQIERGTAAAVQDFSITEQDAPQPVEQSTANTSEHEFSGQESGFRKLEASKSCMPETYDQEV